MIDEAEVVMWQSQAFSGASPFSVSLHLMEEAAEVYKAALLIDAAAYSPPKTAKEAALALKDEIGDCGLLLIALASMIGTTLAESMADKFAKARRRKYEYRPELGYAKHVEDEG